MKHLPLTVKQFEICDFILGNNNIEDTYGRLEDCGYSDLDNRIASKFLFEEKLINSIHPVILTDLGSRYTKKGILKFIQNKRRNDFVNSPVFKIWFVIIPIIISLIFNVLNFRRTNQIENSDKFSRKQYEQIDSIIKIQVDKLNNSITTDSIEKISDF